ncbi:MAG: ANTAR domain-containing response regulator [Alphaproteobacteria bacterium]
MRPGGATDTAQAALKVLREIRALRVLVVHPQDRDAEELVAHLRRIGCRVTAIWPPPAELPAEIQLVFEAIRTPGTETASLVGTSGSDPAVVIGIVEYENPTILQSVIDAGAIAIITKPIRATGLLTTMVMALTVSRRELVNAKKLAKLEARMSALRRVERAKTILMDRNGVSEEEAYSSIRDQAMARRVSIDEIAVAIINASEFFGGGPKRSKSNRQSSS